MPIDPKVGEARERLAEATDPMPELPLPRQDDCSDCGIRKSDVRAILDAEQRLRKAPASGSVQPCAHESRPPILWRCRACTRLWCEDPGVDRDWHAHDQAKYGGEDASMRCEGEIVALVER